MLCSLGIPTRSMTEVAQFQWATETSNSFKGVKLNINRIKFLFFAIVATGFYIKHCRWQIVISALRFSVFTSVQLRFSSFFVSCFYLDWAEICWYIENRPFLVFFGATDRNFMEKYSVRLSWQGTCLWQMTGVRIVSYRSADFNMF